MDTKDGLKTRPNPGADDTVRRWYLAGCAYMSRIRHIDLSHFNRALELFPNDPDVLFFAAAVHEGSAGVRTQAVMRSIKVPRDVTFDVQSQEAELRRAEQLYKRALERNPHLVEARIRLGRVLGLRGRHEEAVGQLRQGLSRPSRCCSSTRIFSWAASSRRSVMEQRLGGRMNGRSLSIRRHSPRCSG